MSDTKSSASTDQEKRIKASINKNELINYQLFLKSLCITALHLKFTDHLDNFEKVIVFVLIYSLFIWLRG
jgi:hypothetical protein